MEKDTALSYLRLAGWQVNATERIKTIPTEWGMILTDPLVGEWFVSESGAFTFFSNDQVDSPALFPGQEISPGLFLPTAAEAADLPHPYHLHCTQAHCAQCQEK